MEERKITCDHCPKTTVQHGPFAPNGWIIKTTNLHGKEHLCSEPCNIALSEKRLKEEVA